MKKLMSLLVTATVILSAMCVAGFPASAASKVSGDYNYYVSPEGTVVISKYKGSASEVVVPGEIDGIKVTEVGDKAFAGCKRIKSVKLPEGLTAIGEDAFYNCKNLKTVSLPDSVESIGAGAFSWSALSEFKLPPKLTVIPEQLLTYTQITEFEIPEGVTEICPIAFCGTKITAIKIPASVTKIGSEAFSCCYDLKECVVPETVNSLGEMVFNCCDKLKKLTIKASVEELGYDFCNECTALENVEIPATVKRIGKHAFESCKNLKKLDLPEGLEVLGMSAFENSGIKSVKLGKNVSGVYGLCGAKKLSKIILDENNPNYKLANGVLYTKAGKRLVLYPAGKSGKTFTVPDTVTGICKGAFYANQKLEEVKLNKGLKKINHWAFENASIKKLVIPGTVSYIGTHAFAHCDKLKSVKFRRNKTTTVWDGVFYECKSLEYAEYPRMEYDDEEYLMCGDFMYDGCSKLKKVRVRDGVKKMKQGAFFGCDNVKVAYIPASVKSIDNYLGRYIYKNDKLKVIKGFVIKGKKNSFAEKYAKEEGISFIAV